MRVLSLSSCPLDPMLGSGKTRLRWSEGLRAMGHSVDMIEPKEFETWHGQSRALRFRQAWGACTFVTEKVRSGEYDLVEFFGGEFGLATWKLSKMKNRPLIVAHTDGLEMLASERERVYDAPVSLTSLLHGWYSRQTHDRLSRAAFAYADAFVAGCEADREFALKLELFTPEQAAVVEPGLDNEYLSMPFNQEKQERIAYVGSWILRKGIKLLAVVMKNLMNQKPGLLLDLYGTGASREEVVSEFPPELHERIVVRPRLGSQEIAQALDKARIFFFPTQYEGFGMTLAEAMACSCAPVTTRTGFGASLRDGEEALLCDFADAEAMERALLSLLCDEPLRQRIARSAWERVRLLTWDTNIAKLEALYTGWVAEHRQHLVGITDRKSGALPLRA